MLYSFTLKFGALLEHTTACGLTIYEVWDSCHQGSSARSEYTSNTVMLVMAEMVNITYKWSCQTMSLLTGVLIRSAGTAQRNSWNEVSKTFFDT